MNSQKSFFEGERFWLEQIPANLRPDESKCEQLEKVRTKYHIPNDIFVGILLSSSVITRRVQGNVYAAAKEDMPEASEKDVLEAVFRSRIFPQNPAGLKLTEEQIQGEMQKICTIGDLIERIIEMEKEEAQFIRDPLRIGERLAKKIDRILNG